MQSLKTLVVTYLEKKVDLNEKGKVTYSSSFCAGEAHEELLGVVFRFVNSEGGRDQFAAIVPACRGSLPSPKHIEKSLLFW